jgi:putative ABC transport system permease protein
MALGAQHEDVMKLVITQGLKLAVLGVGIGLVASLGVTRFMSSLLFGVQATDPVTFAVVALALTGIALAACYVPARRAMRVNPIVALRYE